MSDSESSSEETPLTELRNFPSPEAHKLYQILPSVWMGSFLAAMDGTVVANIMGSIAADFKQEQYKSWIATSYLLTNTAFQPLYGKLSDIVGRKYAVMLAQFFFGFGCLLSCFAKSVPQFAIARAISGMGGGGLGAMSSIIVSDVVSLEERGLYQGYANVNYATGQMIGGPLGAFLLNTIGWRWMFGAQVPAVMTCMILAYNYINIGNGKTLTRENLSRIDYGGSITLVSTITLFLLILSTDLDNRLLLIGLVISTLLFIYIEKYIAKEHVVPVQMVRGIPGVCGGLSFMGSFVSSCTTFCLPLFLQIVQNQTTEQSGAFLIFASLPTSLGSLAVGYALKHTKYSLMSTTRWASFLCIIIQSTGLLTIFAVMKYTSLYNTGFVWKFLISSGMVALGFGYGGVLVSLLVCMIGAVGREGQAVVTGMNYLFRAVGQVLGAGISLSLYENSLVERLTEKLQGTENGKVILRRLLEDTNYLKESKLIGKELFNVILTQYKSSLVHAFIPSIVLLSVSFIVAGYLVISTKYTQK